MLDCSARLTTLRICHDVSTCVGDRPTYANTIRLVLSVAPTGRSKEPSRNCVGWHRPRCGCAAAASDSYGPLSELAAQKFPGRARAAWRRLTRTLDRPAELMSRGPRMPARNLRFPPRHWSRTKSVCAHRVSVTSQKLGAPTDRGDGDRCDFRSLLTAGGCIDCAKKLGKGE